MRHVLTTALDAVGLLLVAAGAGFAAAEVIGRAGFAVSGVVILGGSWLASRPRRRRGDGS